MFDDQKEDPAERALDPAEQAREKAVKFRMHAELAAVFEAVRKFQAGLYPGLDPNIARDIQQTIGKLEKSKSAEHPVLPEPSAPEAARILNLATLRELSTNDYHIHRRPGELMIARWLAGEQVDTFYNRLQAHFDAALEGCKEDERQALEWKQDPRAKAYLAALDKVELKMADVYLREIIRQHKCFVLSTQSADDMNITYLCDYIMGVAVGELVGPKSVPPDEPTERDLAWFFKLFSLRGISDDVERICFFVYMQKSDDDFDFDG